MLLETVGEGIVQLSYLRSFTSLDIAGRAFTPNPWGTSISPPPQEGRAHLPSAPLHAGEPNRLLSSLTAGGLLVSQVPPCAFLTAGGKKARRAECGHCCWAHLGCREPQLHAFREGHQQERHFIHPQQRKLVYLVRQLAGMVAKLCPAAPGTAIP